MVKRSSSVIALVALSLLATTHGFTVTKTPPISLAYPSSTAAFRARKIRATALFMKIASSSNGIFDLPEDHMSSSSASSGNSQNLQQRRPDSAFLQGDDLHYLRQDVLNMRQSLLRAREKGDTRAVRRLSRRILAAQQRDAEFMYQVSLERMEAAAQAGLTEEAAVYHQQAKAARASLPQFQLEGLWVGKYGDVYQMVNVSYVGDLLLAHKVTGDQHVPKGEITFQVDLSPKAQSNGESAALLHPIELSPEAASQWGLQFLQRHAGLGQVAGKGFTNSQWLEGQLILANKYFSFAWMPTGHQVFFGRPSPELTLKLFRESYNTIPKPSSTGVMSSIEDARQHLASCMEETLLLEDDLEVSEGVFRSHDQDYYYDQPGCFE